MSIEVVADCLVQARKSGIPCDAPVSDPPLSIESALRVQARVRELLGESIGGWKASLPKEDRILLAPIYAGGIVSSQPCRVPAPKGMARIEPEIAFVIGKRLPPREGGYSLDEVCGSIAEARCVFELVGSRYISPDSTPYPEMLADCLNNLGLLVGPAIASRDFPGLPAAMPLVIEADGVASRTVPGRHPDGHPTGPLVWLVNFLAGRGIALEPGQIVITGSYAGVLELPLATPVRIRFGDLGEIGTTFVELRNT